MHQDQFSLLKRLVKLFLFSFLVILLEEPSKVLAQSQVQECGGISESACQNTNSWLPLPIHSLIQQTDPPQKNILEGSFKSLDASGQEHQTHLSKIVLIHRSGSLNFSTEEPLITISFAPGPLQSNGSPVPGTESSIRKISDTFTPEPESSNYVQVELVP